MQLQLCKCGAPLEPLFQSCAVTICSKRCVNQAVKEEQGVLWWINDASGKTLTMPASGPVTETPLKWMIVYSMPKCLFRLIDFSIIAGTKRIIGPCEFVTANIRKVAPMITSEEYLAGKR
jgi:hypothetical protein